MDSGYVTVGSSEAIFNQILSPQFSAPDAGMTSQFLGSFGLSPTATTAATTAVMSGANPYAQQAAAAPGLLAPLATATPGAAPAAAPGGATDVTAASITSHPGFIAAVSGMQASGAAPAGALPTSAFGFTATTPAASPTAGVPVVAPPAGAPGAPGGPAATPGADPAAAAAAAPAGEYEVKSGDSLSKIARDLKIADWHTLYDLNKDVIGDNPNLIKVGAKLKLPGAAPAAAAAGGAGAPGSPGNPVAMSPGPAAALTPEQRTAKQGELTALDAQIRTARTDLTNTYALIQPGATAEQRVEGERKTSEAQAKLDQLLAKQQQLQTELGVAASNTVDWTTFGMASPAAAPAT